MTAIMTVFWEGLGTILARVFSRVAPQVVDGITGTLSDLLRHGHFKNMVMLVGESGTGKTTLIRYLTSNSNADPTFSTVDFRLYNKRYILSDTDENGDEKQIKLTVSVGDYRGQNISTLMDGLRKIKGDRAFQKINTLTIIVDLFPPFKNEHRQYEDIGQKAEMPDMQRIQANIDKWNKHTLEVLLAHLNANALTSVCLFINKADLLKGEAGRNAAIDAYQPLIDQLSLWTRSLNDDLVVILGSVKTGEGFNILEERVIRNSVKAGGRI